MKVAQELILSVEGKIMVMVEGAYWLTIDNELVSGGNGQYYETSGVDSGYLGQDSIFCSLFTV